MPNLHKFKLLATQCSVAGSPTRSPTTSPVIHLRRRKTLRMLLTRPTQDPPDTTTTTTRVRHKLKDLFVSSPSPPPAENTAAAKSCRELEQQQQLHHHEQDGFVSGGSAFGVRFRSGSPLRRSSGAALRPITSAFRYRLLRRAWRPMLVTIPE
ncbi:uncharacterized protein LOC107637468 [Arachis ipaensis]|uniref:uncharacterized protein LOC107637468 n=1 Tax=Arachis ipaensis TaxID=130454 RepID=UPI0007AF4358|nr:uncharacterized protein LOC107637468 [Arachis ipaensis]